MTDFLRGCTNRIVASVTNEKRLLKRQDACFTRNNSNKKHKSSN